MFPFIFDLHRKDDEPLDPLRAIRQLRKLRSRRLAVYDLRPYITSEMLKERFSLYGSVEEAKVIRDEQNGLSKCYGVVCYRTLQQATRAKMRSHGMPFHGQRIRVYYFGGVQNLI